MMLQAADLGLGTCYVGMFSQEKLHETFSEMKGLVATAMLPLGYPAETAHRQDFTQIECRSMRWWFACSSDVRDSQNCRMALE